MSSVQFLQFVWFLIKNQLTAKLNHLNFHPLENVARHDPQLHSQHQWFKRLIKPIEKDYSRD